MSRRKKRTIKYWIGRIHLWLGLASGLVVFIVSGTGCIFVFQQEISEVVYKRAMFVAPPGVAPSAQAGAPGQVRVPGSLPLSLLLEKAQSALGSSEPVNSIITYQAPDRAWEFTAYKMNDTALTYFGAVAYFRSVFIDPRTGEVTGYRDYKYDFFNIVKYIHWSLLLNTPYGQPIVGWSTLVFVVLLVSGLVLWWPKRWRRADRRRSLSIMWKARFKRLNYDLHNVLGFYSLILALVLGLTGLVFSFTWFSRAVYVAATGTTVAAPYVAVRSQPAPKAGPESAGGVASGAGGASAGRISPLDIAYADAVGRLPDAKRISVSPAEGPEGVINVYGYKGADTYYDRDDLAFDRYSGRLLQRQDAAQRNRGDRLLNMNYDIHVGAVWGLPGKIIALLACLVCTSLPLTGFLVWWGKSARSKR
jgi:uncharacterized iron-regulated membrane protein